MCFDDAIPALRRLRAHGLTVGIFTNGEQAHQELKLDLVGLRDEVLAAFGCGLQALLLDRGDRYADAMVPRIRTLEEVDGWLGPAPDGHRRSG